VPDAEFSISGILKWVLVLLHASRAGCFRYSVSYLAVIHRSLYASGRSLILPSYQSSLAFSFVAMSSYNHLSSLLTSYPPSARSASTSTPNPTNTDKAILTVMCTCAPLPFLYPLPRSPLSSSRYARPFYLNLPITNFHALQGPFCLSHIDACYITLYFPF